MTPETLVLSGRFRVLSHLGGGGMSEVYLAEQISLGRKVALKVLKRDLGKRPDMAERFKREARLLSTVDHPAVVRVIDFEPSPEATVLVLELAEGDTLEKVLKPGALPLERAVLVLAQIAEGLAAIHDKGIVHRDIKPQNVVLTPMPRGGEQARLLDFGIARLMEIQDPDGPISPGVPLLDVSTVDQNPLISQPGQVVGTPAFVAPEQATGKPIDARTDVYSFGVLAFRVLSGLFPFPGPSSNDFLKQHIGMVPRRLDDAAPNLVGHPELVALVMQCLEKKPDARPANTHVIYETLMRLLPPGPHDSSITTPSRRVLAPVASAPLDPGPARFTAVQETAVRLQVASVKGMQYAAKHAGRLSRLSPEWRRSLLVVGALVLAAPAVWAMLPPTSGERAAQLIREGRYDNAVGLIDARLEQIGVSPNGETPELLSLKAAALHRLGQFDAERELLRKSPYQALHAAQPALLDGLAEDFARGEDDRELQALLQMVPTMFLRPHFEQLALGAGSDRQWGALRWLDINGQHESLDRVDRYSASLNAKQCFIRAAAAKRLAELGELEAIPALRLLSETPKDESETGVINCGQDEAAEAIRQLKKSGK